MRDAQKVCCTNKAISFIDKTVKANTKYTYTVTGVAIEDGRDLDGTPSDPVSLTTDEAAPTAPRTPTLSNIDHRYQAFVLGPPIFPFFYHISVYMR